MDAAHAPIPTDPASPWSAVDPPRHARRLVHPVVAGLLALTWVLASLSMLVGMRHASADELRSAIAHHAVVSPEVQYERPSALRRWVETLGYANLSRAAGDDSGNQDLCTRADGATTDCPLQKGSGEDAWLVWRTGPAHLGRRWMSVAEAARVLGTRPTENSVMFALMEDDGVRGGINWSLPALANLCACAVAIAGPRPRTGTRWFWIWALSLPVGIGVLWYVIAECWSGPEREPRRSGWWGLLISVVAELALTAVLAGVGARI